MGSYQSPLSAIVKGALAGAAGTYVMGEAMSRVPRLLEQAGRPLPPSPPGPTAPDSPTEEVAERLVEGVAEEPIDEEAKATGGQLVHWSYGAGWGAAFGVLQGSFRLPTLLAGLLFGALVGSVADTIMPRLGLQVPPSDRPRALTMAYMGYHLIYGLTVGLVWSILNFGRRG
jgi:hypothetical protein